jgi:crotonobetainyl-CoA:carnitine CoA-transferase CaiB-like acyl-CoA transferase
LSQTPSATHPTNGSSLPLSGVRVVDLTLALAGPAATQRLAEWGAEVIKVEPPNGENTRHLPLVNAWLDGETTLFLALNRSKRSITMDLKNPEALEQLFALIRTSDVFVHNFRPGVAEKLGLGAEAVRGANPGLVYASVSGYGADGPDAQRPGQDLLLQAYAGTMFTAGAATDAPSVSGMFVADVLGSHFLVEGILLALRQRDRTGEGQEVQVSMLGAMLEAQGGELVTYLNTGQGPERGKARRANALIEPPYGVFATSDGWIAVAMADPVLLGAAIHSEFVQSLGTRAKAFEFADEVAEIVAEVMLTDTAAAWREQLEAGGVWCGPVHGYADLEDLPQIQAGRYFIDAPLPGGGTHKIPSNAMKLSAHPTLSLGPAPRLGEHNHYYLSGTRGAASASGGEQTA